MLTTGKGRMSGQDDQSLMKDLVGVFKSTYPRDLKFAATRCMGLLSPTSLIDMTKSTHLVQKPEQKEESVKQLLELQGKVLECGANTLLSPVSSTSLAAAGTLGVILSTEMGLASLFMTSPIKMVLLHPFAVGRKKGKNYSSILSAEEVISLKVRLGVTTSDDSWCWNAKLWEPLETDGQQQRVFDDWVRHLVTSIILCCFQMKDDAEKCGKSRHTVEVNRFFWQCQRMTLIDPTFAATVFPALILALVTEQDTAGSNDMTGVSEIISGAFKTLLGSKHEHVLTMVQSTKDSPFHKAMTLAVDTLDVLRTHSQSVFEISKPRGKKVTNEQKKNSLSSSESRAVPYGVILHLDGLVVAQACIDIDRFASALFYLDLYLQAQLGTSGGVFEAISTSMSIVDVISGFKSTSDICGSMNNPTFQQKGEGSNVLSSTMKAMSMASRCYSALGELDAVDALQNLLASMSLMEGSLDHNATTVKKDLQEHGSIRALESLSIQASISRELPSAHPLNVVESFDEMGLQGFIKSYINGVCRSHHALTQVDGMELKDQWFKNDIEDWVWKKLLLNNKQHAVSATGSRRFPYQQPGSASKGPGFFECVSNGLRAFMQNDATGSFGFLSQARSCVVDMISQIGEEHPSQSSSFRIVDRLKALKLVDELVEGKKNLQSDISHEMRLFNVSWRMNEVILVAEAAKSSNTSHLDLETHLWQICENAIQQRSPQVAETSLARIRSLLLLPTNKSCDPAATSSVMKQG
jgi:hypothetical protein